MYNLWHFLPLSSFLLFTTLFCKSPLAASNSDGCENLFQYQRFSRMNTEQTETGQAF